MTEQTKNRLHLIYSIVLSVMLAVAGILLVIACVGIYNSGNKPFTPESVAAAFSGIAVPVWLCVALVIGGFALDGFFPAGVKKQKIEKQYATILARLREKLDLPSCDEALRRGILREQKSRKLHKAVTLVLLAVGSAVFLSYGANPANFHQSEITASMEKAMYVLLPCMAVPFGYAVFAAFRAKKSMLKEIGLVKAALAASPAGSRPSPAAKDRSRSLLAARWAILGIGVVILVYGFFAGGTNDVLTKAINICTECVGLG